MNDRPDAATEPPALRLSRHFHAPPATVFAAWTRAEHVKRWFCPEGFTVPEARVEAHAGGPFEYCMRAPSGEEHWVRGVFREVSPQKRLVIDMAVADRAGKPLFRALTEVDFAESLAGTRLDILQTYTLFEPALAGPMTAGAQEGWRTTLDKLEREVIAMRGGGETGTRRVERPLL